MKTKCYLHTFSKLFMLVFSFFLMNSKAPAQNTFPANGSVGIGTTTPNASSLLEIKSTTKGFLTPRMTQAQRNAIVSPVTGLLIFQTNNTPGLYYYNGNDWSAVTAKNFWSLKGNAGTSPSVNFIGTTDAQALVFKVNNVKAGYIDYTTNGNISFGYQSLLVNTTGFGNTASGYNSLKANTTGSRNTGFGFYTLAASNADNNTATGTYALSSNTTGTGNVATGVNSLSSNTLGNHNSAFGTNALYTNTTGIENTANGYGALFTNFTGNQNAAFGKYALYNNTASLNTAVGYNALFFNTSGTNNTSTGAIALQNNTTSSNNTANGYAALYSNSVGNENTAFGVSTLYANISGTDNTATGFEALKSNTASFNTADGVYALHSNTGGVFNTAAGYLSLSNNLSGSYNTATGVSSLEQNNGSQNTAVGFNALKTQGYGSNNTAVGYNAMLGTNLDLGGFEGSTAIGSYSLYKIQANASGYPPSNNTGVGFSALYNNTIGAFNTALGVNSLYTITNGSGNTAIGDYADVNSGSISSSTIIGEGAIATASSQVRIGNNSVSSIGGYVNWTNISDGRVKKNIKQNVPGLTFINKLTPITYTLNLEASDKIVQRQTIKDREIGNVSTSPDEAIARKIKEAIVYTGFIAQDVEKAANSLNFDFSGVDAAKNNKDLYGLRYADFVVPLVKAVQELSKSNDDKDAKIENLQKQIDDLKAIVLSNNASSIQNTTGVILTNSSLEQNIPNPFTHTTTIAYNLPQKFTNAQILITDNSGKTIKSVNISGIGKGSLNVDAATLASGAYNYSLIVDGRTISTKQMVLAK